jgi:DNA-binding transcriptional ArsR family regulator
LAKRNGQRELQELERVFAALAHASRRQILLVLQFHGGSMTAGEIAARFECTWPTTTRHLRQLEEAKLVRVEQVGRARVYCLDADYLSKAVGGWMRWFVPDGRRS